MTPIRLFVGTSSNGEDYEAEAVLEYTARKNCSLPLDITFMRQAATGPWSGWACGSGRTPFTHFRWSIPSVCKYEGRAIYCDVDFLFVADLAELWEQPIPHVGLVRNATGKLSTSCILFSCSQALGYVPKLEMLREMPDAHGTVVNYFRGHKGLLDPCVGNWDCPDLSKARLGDSDLKAVHYTRIEHQLHLKHAIPRLRAEGRKHWYAGEVKAHPRPELQAYFDSLLENAQIEGYTRDHYRVPYFDGANRRNFVYHQR